MATAAVETFTDRPFDCLIRGARNKEQLVFSLFRNRRIFAEATLTPQDERHPLRCRVRVADMDVGMQPKAFLAQAKRAQRLFLLDDSATRSSADRIRELTAPRERSWAKVCSSCLRRGKVTILERPVRWGTQWLCVRCARREVERIGRSEYWYMSRKMAGLISKAVEKTLDVDEALRLLSPSYDPDRDWALSLYDVIERKTGEHPDVAVDDIPSYSSNPERIEPILRRLREEGITRLLPVQIQALENGLLRGEDILIVSSTSSGKTLIAEIAGIPEALEGRKFLYLTPLVALANLRYTEFDNKYADLGLVTAIRVGVGRIRTEEELNLNMDIDGADIVVGTYEGIEQVLRSGEISRLGEIGVVAIDEVQNLKDEDRGHRLDGLIKKLRALNPKAQFLYLSATVGNPDGLAEKLGSRLVFSDERPVPVERHVIPISSPEAKLRIMARLVGREFNSVSPDGYRGQTIIFTNSRRKCHQISYALAAYGVKAIPYHSGLPYEKRRMIERDFVSQRIPAVVTTAALAAGVDLPASQVIFETLAMGSEWISTAEFHQMLGRAGRLGFHESGKAVLMIEPGRTFSRSEKRTEDEVVMDLLTSPVEDVVPLYDEEEMVEQILADVSTLGKVEGKDLSRLQRFSTGFNMPVERALRILVRAGLVKRKRDSVLITPIGRITSTFFLTPEEAEFIIRSIKRGHGPLDIIAGVSVFDRVYLSEKLQARLEGMYRRRISSRFFDPAVVRLLSRPKRGIPRWMVRLLGRIASDLFSCRCPNRPECGCAEKRLSKLVVELRTRGMDPDSISRRIEELYEAQIYPGDVLEYLNDVARLSLAISRFSEELGREKTSRSALTLFEEVVRS